MDRSRLIKIGDALSQLGNVLLLPRHLETTANESISGRSFRCGWTTAQKFIDFLFSPFEKEHCRMADIYDEARSVKMLLDRGYSITPPASKG